MAHIIKKISAFDSLPAKGVTPDIVFPVVKDSTNYKLPFENLYAAMNCYMSNSESSLNDKFVNKEELENYLTKEELNEIYSSCALKEDTFTKEEVQNKIDEAIVSLDNRIQTNESDIEKLKESTSNIEALLKTDGDGNYVLGDDGKYHNLTSLSLLDYGSIQLTNDMVDENNILTVSFSMPKLPYKHIIHAHITLGNSIFKETNAGILAIKYDGEINDLEKRFTTGKSVIELAFENEVVQFQDGKGGLSNFIKISTYFNEDKISDTIKIRSTVLELLHDTYDTVITLTLTGKLPENVTHDLTWCVFGHGILDPEGE